jgi:hypothetical protein
MASPHQLANHILMIILNSQLAKLYYWLWFHFRYNKLSSSSSKNNSISLSQWSWRSVYLLLLTSRNKHHHFSALNFQWFLNSSNAIKNVKITRAWQTGKKDNVTLPRSMQFFMLMARLRNTTLMTLNKQRNAAQQRGISSSRLQTRNAPSRDWPAKQSQEEANSIGGWAME